MQSRPPWSQVARKLTSPSPFPPHSKFSSPQGITSLIVRLTKTTSRSRLHIVRNKKFREVKLAVNSVTNKKNYRVGGKGTLYILSERPLIHVFLRMSQQIRNTNWNCFSLKSPYPKWNFARKNPKRKVFRYSIYMLQEILELAICHIFIYLFIYNKKNPRTSSTRTFTKFKNALLEKIKVDFPGFCLRYYVFIEQWLL